MPTYVYQCQSCSLRVEAVQSFHDPALTTCEECGGALRKVFSPVGIVFKGSGFYKNDSRSTSTRKSTADSAKDAPASPAPASATPAPAAAAATPAATTSSASSTTSTSSE